MRWLVLHFLPLGVSLSIEVHISSFVSDNACYHTPLHQIMPVTTPLRHFTVLMQPLSLPSLHATSVLPF